MCIALVVDARASVPVQLDDLDSLNLVPISRFLIDESGQQAIEALTEERDWQVFRHDQLRIGLLKGKLWVESEFSTTGRAAKDVILEFDRQIDFIDIAVYRDGFLQESHNIAAFLQFPADLPNSNKNVYSLTLEPNADYRLLMAFHGNNGVTGAIKLWEKLAYQKTDQVTFILFIAYAVAVLIISAYNLSAFVATQYRAFVYHAVYGFSMLMLQAAQYGYLDFLLGNDTFRNREVVILLSIASLYSAVFLFISQVIESHREPYFALAGKLVVGFNVVLAIASFFISYHLSLVLFVANIALGCILGGTHYAIFVRQQDPRAWKMAMLLLLFAPSATLFTLSRFGYINNTFVTEYLLLFSITLELLVISMLLFGHIRSMHRMFWRSQFLDPGNQLPNIFSLRKQLRQAKNQNADFALTYIWVAGLEKTELARGSEFRDKYLKLLSEHIETQLENSSFKPDFLKSSGQAFCVFYCEKNTLGVLTSTLSEREQRHIQVLFNHALGNLGYTYGYNLDVALVIGSTNALAGYNDVEQTLQQAAVTLSQCIQSGRSAMLYTEEVGYNELRQITLLNEFEQALRNGQFYLEWQPQINASTQAIVGLETLVRWQHPRYGEVAPDHFIPLLEQSTKITSLSLWVLQKTIDQMPAFLKRFPGIDVSVNLSVYDLMNNQLLPSVDEILSGSSGDIAKRMTLEITESVHMEDNITVLATVRELQQRGFRISIDDFGAGYASFGYLQSLPVDELKIDRRYALSIEEPNSQAIIQSIIDLASRLNMSVVIEGVENRRQQELFTKWGAHRLQGWCLGKPSSGESILQLSADFVSEDLVVVS
ncbi:MAG: EAL domain-containing protein [Thiolinea sp.]